MGAQKTDPKGQNYDPEARTEEGPVHEVTLSPFLIGKYGVTQGQWNAVMGSNPSKFRDKDDRPVDNVSWEDVQEFEKRTGLSLPTEAQWEYSDLVWCDASGGNPIPPLGGKGPNGFGLHDMHGSQWWEWCEDVYDPGFYGKPEARKLDPASITGIGLQALRGGGLRGYARFDYMYVGAERPGAIFGCRAACRAP
jgi:formylglycine-generating enzyme required for sulfatase activity